jgi:hypothetical protein
LFAGTPLRGKKDIVVFEEVDRRVTIAKSSQAIDSFTRALESTLSEWDSPEDDEAFRDL